MVARVSTLIGLTWSHCPNCSFRSRRFTICWARRGNQAASKAVRAHPVGEFSDEVLERYPINLGVLPVHGIEWSDLGEPQRVMAVLSRLGIYPEWEAA